MGLRQWNNAKHTLSSFLFNLSFLCLNRTPVLPASQEKCLATSRVLETVPRLAYPSLEHPHADLADCGGGRSF